jgi:hypothetical protein
VARLFRFAALSSNPPNAPQFEAVQQRSPERSRINWRRLMKKLIMAIAAAAALGTVVPARATSEIDCMVMWDRADRNKNGILDGEEATPYLDAIRKSIKKYAMKTVDQLSEAEFMAACADDVFKISFYRAQLL